jgi:hypothetical protein
MVLHVIPIVQIIDEANRRHKYRLKIKNCSWPGDVVATLARATYCPVWSLAATMIQIS